jgi:hypothetical protein
LLPFEWRERETKSDEKPDVTGLYANAVRPAGVTEQSNLPVVVVSTWAILDEAPIDSETSLSVVLRRGFRYW